MADISTLTVNNQMYNVKDATARSAMTGATSQTGGTQGQVPTPQAGDDEKYLRGDGTWDEVAQSTPESTGFMIAANEWTAEVDPDTSETFYYKEIQILGMDEYSVFWIDFMEDYYANAPKGILATAGTNKVTLTTEAAPVGTVTGNIVVMKNGHGRAGGNDYYTQSETDDLLDLKADANSVYTQSETDDLLGAKFDASKIVFSATAPSNPVEGMIWLKPET